MLFEWKSEWMDITPIGSIENYCLSEEIEQWLIENEIDFHCIQPWEYQWPCLEIDDDNKAMLFKLTWM